MAVAEGLLTQITATEASTDIKSSTTSALTTTASSPLDVSCHRHGARVVVRDAMATPAVMAITAVAAARRPATAIR